MARLKEKSFLKCPRFIIEASVNNRLIQEWQKSSLKKILLLPKLFRITNEFPKPENLKKKNIKNWFKRNKKSKNLQRKWEKIGFTIWSLRESNGKKSSNKKKEANPNNFWKWKQKEWILKASLARCGKVMSPKIYSEWVNNLKKCTPKLLIKKKFKRS